MIVIPKSSIFASILLFCFFSNEPAFAQYKPGIIVDQYNQKYRGWIEYKSKKKVGYKELENSEAEILGVKDVKAFTIEADSFVTIHYHNYLKNILIDDFSKVLLKGPEYMLFKATYRKPTDTWSISSNSTQPYFRRHTTVRAKVYLFQNAEATLALTKENFYDQMPAIIRDNESLCAKIKSKDLSYRNIDNIIREYEHWKKTKTK